MTDIDTLRRHREALGSLARATYTHADDVPALAWALAKLDEEIAYEEERDAWARYLGIDDVPPSDGGARQMDEHERVTPEDVARITAMYERVCSENERLREREARVRTELNHWSSSPWLAVLSRDLLAILDDDGKGGEG